MFKKKYLDKLLSLYLKDNHDENGNLISDWCLDLVWCRMMGGCGVYETCGSPLHCDEGTLKLNLDWKGGKNSVCVNLQEEFDEYWHPDPGGGGSKSAATHESRFECIDDI